MSKDPILEIRSETLLNINRIIMRTRNKIRQNRGKNFIKYFLKNKKCKF